MRIVLALSLILFALPLNASELRITVEGIRSPHGTILIGLYDSLESFTRAIELSDKDGFLNDPNHIEEFVTYLATLSHVGEFLLREIDRCGAAAGERPGEAGEQGTWPRADVAAAEDGGRDAAGSR